jgi:alpha-galactosidase
MTPEVTSILTNSEAIAIDQDPLGIQGFKYHSADSVEVWFKPLANDEWAVCFLNRNEIPKPIEFNWTKEEVVDKVFDKEPAFNLVTYSIRNVWTHTDEGTTKKVLKTELPGHDVLMLRLSPVK